MSNIKFIRWPNLFSQSRQTDSAVAFIVEGEVNPADRAQLIDALSLQQSDILATSAKKTTQVVSVTSSDSTILVDDDSAGGAVAVNLPLASVGNGFVLNIKKLGSTGNVTITATGGALIDGIASQQLLLQYENLTLLSDGTNWHVL